MAESEARWYVVHTYSGYENKVATDLMTNESVQALIKGKYKYAYNSYHSNDNTKVLCCLLRCGPCDLFDFTLHKETKNGGTSWLRKSLKMKSSC